MVSVVTHFFNEELLLPDWINHHKEIFDHGILINHNSTDNSVDIVKQLLPEGWLLVDTQLPDFDAVANDQEVMYWESTLPKDEWKLALNTTEFVFCPNLKDKLDGWQQQHPDALAFGSRAVCLVDKDPTPIESPIFKNRTSGFINYEPGVPVVRRWRYIHKAIHGHYEVGRHGVGLPNVCLPEFLHLHFLYSPWPECKPRKLQIQTRIPEHNKRGGLGFEHLVNEEVLDARREDTLKLCSNLLDNSLFKEAYEHYINESPA